MGIPAYALEFQNLAVPKVGNVWHDGSLGIPGHYVRALPTTRGGNMGTPRPIHVPASRSTMALGLRHTRQQDVDETWRRPITRIPRGPLKSPRFDFGQAGYPTRGGPEIPFLGGRPCLSGARLVYSIAGGTGVRRTQPVPAGEAGDHLRQERRPSQRGGAAWRGTGSSCGSLLPV